LRLFFLFGAVLVARAALKNLGFDEATTEIGSGWTDVAKYWRKPQVEYQYAYPEDLLRELAKLTLDGLRESGISVIPQEALTNEKDDSVRALLNEAWRVFWKDKLENFRSWEENAVQKRLKTLNSRQ